MWNVEWYALGRRVLKHPHLLQLSRYLHPSSIASLWLGFPRLLDKSTNLEAFTGFAVTEQCRVLTKKGTTMKKTFTFVLCVLAFASGLASAQSGNFSASGTGASCVIADGGVLSGGTALNSFTTTVATNTGSGLTLDIRPSLQTGLFTQTKIDPTVSSASADVGIQVCVNVDGSATGVLPQSCVTYDEQFQQVSSDLFSQLAACALVTSTSACSTTSDCSAIGTTYVCNNPTGGSGTGICVVPNPLCDLNLVESSLSAHSFDFVVAVPNKKPHVVTASWRVVGLPANNTGGTNSSVASCVGPGIVTVTQYNGATLNFNNN
jgi:hypothetical protein